MGTRFAPLVWSAESRPLKLSAGSNPWPGGTAAPPRRETENMGTLTVANQLALLRMLLIPAFVILLLYGQQGWALTVFVLAGLTDGLDGLIARWRNQRTSLGAWLDPAAAKLLLVTTLAL